MNKKFFGKLLATILVVIAQTIAGHILRKELRRKPKP
jgi:hypothetical protein